MADPVARVVGPAKFGRGRAEVIDGGRGRHKGSVSGLRSTRAVYARKRQGREERNREEWLGIEGRRGTAGFLTCFGGRWSPAAWRLVVSSVGRHATNVAAAWLIRHAGDGHLQVAPDAARRTGAAFLANHHVDLPQQNTVAAAQVIDG